MKHLCLGVACLVFLFGGVAAGVFVLGVTKLAALNPFYALSDWTDDDTTQTNVSATVDEMGREATLLSAFYGIDGGLPKILRFFFCPFAPGNDGMPVIFSQELDVDSVQAGDFRVVSQSGAVGAVFCATFSPASDPGELRTVLLGGEFGSAADQPVTVEIIGNILSIDGAINFKGAKADVVPLEDGPSISLAKLAPEAEWRAGTPPTRLPWGGGSGCPKGTKLAGRVTWEGGVTKPDGSDADDEDRRRYQVVFATDGTGRVATPDALADLGDGDNNHLLCFEEGGTPKGVHFPAGYLTDPRDDLNPETSALVQR
ncbi:MAG: hypothetical protein QNJ03_06190 [Dinoroseobacter sp.]|nr:hypothetical protein [Dinoroseobacter sp.]